MKSEFIDIKGVPIAYRVIGNKSNVPLLCLQHFTGNMNDWDPAVIDGLSETRQLILFDNNGVGESGGKTPNNVSAMATDTINFLQAMKVEKVDILGFSLGGFIAQLLMKRAANLIRKSILVGTCQQGSERISRFPEFVRGADKFTGADRYLYFFFENTAGSRLLGQAVLQRFIERDSGWAPLYTQQTIVAQTEAIVGWGQMTENDSPLLTHIRHPVLVINGSNDHMFDTSDSYVMFKQLPNAILSLYPNSAHGSLFQYPELFASQAIYFLDNNN